MAIHHAQVRQAENMGFALTEKAPHVQAFHPNSGVTVFGVSAKDAINQMTSFLNLFGKAPDIRFSHDATLPTHGVLRDSATGAVSTTRGTPTELFREFPGGIEWQQAGMAIEDTFSVDPDEERPEVDATPLIKRNEAGVPFDGATAYKEGLFADSNPYEEGTDEADEWDSQWDEAADAATQEEEDNPKGGSVVASKYRAIYAERGHPNHCGDWLADLLNNYCVGKKETDLATFEQICFLNGVDTSKYNRTTPGWQGRIRMTGRNLLAKRVFEAGKIVVPNREPEGEPTVTLDAPADWVRAQRYKGKANG